MSKKRVTPFNLVKSAVNNNWVPVEIRDARYALCQSCPKFQPVTKTCSICHCFMSAKTFIPEATCALPVGERLWDSYQPPVSEGD